LKSSATKVKKQWISIYLNYRGECVWVHVCVHEYVCRERERHHFQYLL
jgi:hypothetical protein